MEYVQTEAALNAVAESLAGAPLVAIDTEAAGYHRYHDRICLLQLSTRSYTWVLDALALPSLAVISRIFSDPKTEIVLHDADYDLRLLERDYGVHVTRLFDTKIAAQLIGEPQIGLAGLVEKFLGVRMDKKHQRADWAQRPLSAELLEYAAEDTRHLPAVRDRLLLELERHGRTAWAEEEFRLRESIRWRAPAEDSDPFLRLKHTRDLSRRQLAALREIFAWRERVARERDVATFRVLGNESLVAIARSLPRANAALAAVDGISPGLIARRGAEILDAITTALNIPDAELPVYPKPPRRPPPDPELEQRIDRLRVARDEAARRLRIDRGFLMPRQQLEDIARRRPTTPVALKEIPAIRDWQIEAVGVNVLIG